MSNRKTETAAEHVEDAVATALADVLGLDEQDVRVRVEAPGIAERQGRWHVAVSYEVADPPEPTADPGGDGGPIGALADDPDAVEADLTDTSADATDTVASPGAPVAQDAAADRDDVASDGEGTRPTTDESDEDHGDHGDHEDEAEVAEAADVGPDDDHDGDREEDEVVIDLEEEAEAAADFVEGLLDALDLPGDLRITYGEDHAEVEIIDVGSGALIGRRGQTLEAIQELLRCSLQREFQRRARVKIDVEGYRSRRLEKLLEKADEAIDAVLDSGNPERLEPMDVFERKAVHHRVAKVDGLTSRSQGREPARRVIIERG